MKPVLKPLAEIPSDLLNVILPPVCVSCGGRAGEGAKFICSACRDKIAALGGRKLVFRDRPGIAIARSLYFYDLHRGVDLGAAVRALKYAAYRGVAAEIAELLAVMLSAEDLYLEADALTAVPLHPSKRRERGFNQAELIARKLAQILEIPCENMLKKIKNTGSQTELSPPQRELNVKGAFRIAESASPEGNIIILLDDQVTTGATIASAAEELIRAGAEKVLGLSVTN